MPFRHRPAEARIRGTYRESTATTFWEIYDETNSRYHRTCAEHNDLRTRHGSTGASFAKRAESECAAGAGGSIDRARQQHVR